MSTREIRRSQKDPTEPAGRAVQDNRHPGHRDPVAPDHVPCRASRRLTRRALGFACSCRGAAALEFALILPIVVFAFLSMVDAAAAVRIQMRLDSIIRSGGQVAMRGEELGRVRSVLAEAARLDGAGEGDQGGPVVAADRVCLCEAEVACDTVCADGGPPSVVIRLAAEQTAEGLFLPSIRLSSSARVEVR